MISISLLRRHKRRKSYVVTIYFPAALEEIIVEYKYYLSKLVLRIICLMLTQICLLKYVIANMNWNLNGVVRYYYLL